MPLAVVRLRKVYYELHGEHPGTPLVLVMGMGGSCHGWLPLQVPDFSRRYTTLIYDHPGVGRSEDTGEPFTTADLAEVAAGLLDSLRIRKAHVLGVFMGGMVAQELALRHPERVGRLVLVGTWARPDVKRRLLLQQWRDLARSGATNEALIRERLIWTLQDETLEQTDLIDNMVEHYSKEGAPSSGEVFARQCEAGLRHDTADRLAEIRQRTLVICGRNDSLTPPKLHRELADGIPNAKLVTLAEAGHLVVAECAQRFNELVLNFLAAD